MTGWLHHANDSIFITALRGPTTCWRTAAARRMFPTHQPNSSRQLDALPPFSHSCARNAPLGCEKDIWKCHRDCAYTDGFPILVRSRRHCFMQLIASVVVLEQRATNATLSPVHVPQNCDHLQLIFRRRVLVAPCMHLRHTHWPLQHTVWTSGTHTDHCSTLYAPQAHTLTNAAHCTTCYNAQQFIYVPCITFRTNSNNYP